MSAPTVRSPVRADHRDPAVRLRRFLDPGSLVPLAPEDDSGVRIARGRISGHRVFAYCTDARNVGGALGADGCRRIVTVIESALRERSPVIGLWHSGGARLADGVESMDGAGRVFAAMTRASGRIAQLSVVLGPAAGAAAYGPALTDFVIMSDTGRMFVTGPDVVRAVTGEMTDMESLGGVEAHGRRSGVAHITVRTEDEARAAVSQLVDLLERPGSFDLASVTAEKDLRSLLPSTARRAYDVRPLVRELLDAHAGAESFAEIQPRWAANVVVGLGRLAGRTVGVIANNPLRKAGCLDSPAAEKASRFVRMCDSFGIPMIVLVDVPGYLPGVGQEWGGVIRRGAKLLHAFAEAVTPRVTLVTRKSYGGAYIAMNSHSLGATAVYAWPEAEVAVMNAETAVGIIHRKRLAAAPRDEQEPLRRRLAVEHQRASGGVERAVELGVIDQVIDPRHTRLRLATVLASAPLRRGEHGNIPL